MKKLMTSVCALAVCLAVTGAASGKVPPPAGATDIRIVNLAALDAALAQYRGQAILLNFWAIWCEPCVAEMPELLEVGRQFQDSKAVVLTVSYDLMVPEVTPEGVLDQVRKFVAARSIDVPVFIYEADDYAAINKRFGLPGPVPATVAIDPSGAVVDRHAGRADKARFVEMMRKALGR